MYSLIGSLVIMCDHVADALPGMLMCVMIQIWAVKAPNGHAHSFKKVHVHFDHMYVHHMCFIHQVRLGLTYEMDPRVM